jgi:hypothetical protein
VHVSFAGNQDQLPGARLVRHASDCAAHGRQTARDDRFVSTSAHDGTGPAVDPPAVADSDQRDLAQPAYQPEVMRPCFDGTRHPQCRLPAILPLLPIA